MKILCIIDALGPGGAERQMTGLSSMLKKEGHEVVVLYHEPKHFFVDDIISSGVSVNCLGAGKNRVEKLLSFRRKIKEYRPDVVISYLHTSNLIASIIKASGLKFKLIVSERNTNTNKKMRDFIKFNLYRFADYVVPNSFSQETFIFSNFSFLKNKIRTIPNYVDTSFFLPVEKKRGTEVLIAATLWEPKNAIGLIKAVKILKEKGLKFHVSWFGKVPGTRDYIIECENLIKQLEVQDYIQLKDKTHNIKEEYQKADYFCLPSFFEGTPNVICEAIATGLPVICSNICDNPRYVKNGINGFLFDPHNVNSIAEAIENILSIDNQVYQKFKINSRYIAEEELSSKKFIDKYLSIIK